MSTLPYLLALLLLGEQVLPQLPPATFPGGCDSEFVQLAVVQDHVKLPAESTAAPLPLEAQEHFKQLRI